MNVFKINDSILSLALYTDVNNSKQLLERMQAEKLELEVAFLNASLIPDIFPVLGVAHKALIAMTRDSLTTHTLHSEFVYNYTGSKHITESFKRCGISDTTISILAACFDATTEEASNQAKSLHMLNPNSASLLKLAVDGQMPSKTREWLQKCWGE